MRGFLAGFLIALTLGLGIGVAGAKVVNVTNPMTANLDGGGYAITNTASVWTGNLFATGSIFAGNAYGIQGELQLGDGTHPNGPQVIAGTRAPTVGDPYANPGSIYLRWTPIGTGEEWFFNGIAWTCIAGCP